MDDDRLVKLAARAFYDDITKGDNQPKTGRSDNRGIAVVVLDALTRFFSIDTCKFMHSDMQMSAFICSVLSQY